MYRLKQLSEVLRKIQKLNWGKELGRECFLRNLDNDKNNKLNRYIKELEDSKNYHFPSTEQKVEEFKELLSDLFRLNTFARTRQLRERFKQIKFPFQEYDAALKALEAFWAKEWNLELLVPNLFNEKCDYEDKEGALIYSKVTVIDKSSIEIGSIVDFNKIGFMKDDKITKPIVARKNQ
jgi:hypothetical protein